MQFDGNTITNFNIVLLVDEGREVTNEEREAIAKRFPTMHDKDWEKRDRESMMEHKVYPFAEDAIKFIVIPIAEISADPLNLLWQICNANNTHTVLFTNAAAKKYFVMFRQIVMESVMDHNPNPMINYVILYNYDYDPNGLFLNVSGPHPIIAIYEDFVGFREAFEKAISRLERGVHDF